VNFRGSGEKMSDHLVVYVDRLIPPPAVQPVAEPQTEGPSGPGPETAGPSRSVDERSEGSDEKEPLIQMAECRICQEEDCVNNLETPCACSGSLKV
jgi:hypothetical protein